MNIKKCTIIVFFFFANILVAQKKITIKDENISCVISVNSKDSTATIQLQNLTMERYIYVRFYLL